MEYFCEINGKHLGPVSKAVLMNEGLTPKTEVYCEQTDTWQPADSIPELNAMLRGLPFTNRFEPKRYALALYGKIVLNTTTAYLYIYDDYIFIDPSTVSSLVTAGFGFRRMWFRLDEITGFHNGILATFSLTTSSGRKIGMSSWKKKGIINEIETRRKALVESEGLQAAPFIRS